MVKCYKKFVCLIVSAVLVNVFMLYSPCSALTVELSWNASTESTLAGYKVYYQADSSTLPFQGTGALEGAAPVDVYNWTTATISGLDPDRTYYFAVTAYDINGLESSFSNIVTVPGSASSAFSSGDINADGNVNVADALLALQVAVGKVAPDSGQLGRGDVAPIVNGTSQPNGKIDIGDVIVILGKVTG
ncbi:MAG: hypothetical protein HGB32_11655 [Geobacteraceae bacterium]|nr:hypothetical protein [Geobacteraceae bacterium]NTW80783.1 hypothetical protein [Geobacteraceae bacterium]